MLSARYYQTNKERLKKARRLVKSIKISEEENKSDGNMVVSNIKPEYKKTIV